MARDPTEYDNPDPQRAPAETHAKETTGDHTKSPEVVYPRKRDSWRPYEVRQSKFPKSLPRNTRRREYRRSYEVGRSRPQKSPRRDSQKRDSRGYKEQRSSLDSVPPAPVTPTGGSMSVQPSISVFPAIVAPPSQLASVQPSDRVPPAAVTPTGEPVSVQPLDSGPPATATPTRGLVSVQPDRVSPTTVNVTVGPVIVQHPDSGPLTIKTPIGGLVTGDPTKYDNPDPQRAPAEIHGKESTGDPTKAPTVEEILAKEIARDPTQYDDPDRHAALSKKENHAKVLIPSKNRVPNRLSQTHHKSPSQYWGPGVVYRGLSVTLESGTISTGKQTKQPNFYPVLISKVKMSVSEVEICGFIVRSYSHYAEPLQWIAGKKEAEKEILLLMPSKTPAATPPGFGEPINTPGYVGLKTQWLVAYQMCNTFDTTQFKFKPFSPQTVMDMAEFKRILGYALAKAPTIKTVEGAMRLRGGGGEGFEGVEGLHSNDDDDDNGYDGDDEHNLIWVLKRIRDNELREREIERREMVEEWRRNLLVCDAFFKVKILDPATTREHDYLHNKCLLSFSIPNVHYHAEFDGRYYIFLSRLTG
ncbi:hypothetical protein MMC31_003775 [Peltigera leucophlebia]|nr:hypothetical protein [Peltigera leucophlebia]